MKSANFRQLVNVTSRWMRLQDLAFEVVMNDSTKVSDNDINVEYYNVADSFGSELERLALARKWTLGEVVKFKLQTTGRNDKVGEVDFKAAISFYEEAGKLKPYQDKNMAMDKYNALLDGAGPFQKEGQLLQFLREEDRCFRSLMLHLDKVTQEELQHITDRTTQVLEDVYKNAVATQEEKVSKRVLMFLSMRFNRRILQNAAKCREDIRRNIPLSAGRQADYRWMLVQPVMNINGYSMACLTEEQTRQLVNLADELPKLLSSDGSEPVGKRQQGQFMDILVTYLLKNYIKSII